MSSRLECICSAPLQSPPPPHIDNLPQELLNQIFSLLSLNDLQAAACVSRRINCSVIAAARCNEFRAIKNFIQILLQKIPGQRERLAKISQNIASQNFANLQLLKRAILDVKAQLICVIKTVDQKIVDDLYHVQPPPFLEKIVTLAVLERQIDEANLIPDEDDRSYVLRDIPQPLAQAGDIERALAVAGLISDEDTRGYALQDISRVLGQAGKIDKAVALAQSIANENKRGDTLRDISTGLASKGNIDKALEVATSISLEWMRGSALRIILQFLTHAGNFDKAMAVARLMPNQEEREHALRAVQAERLDALGEAQAANDAYRGCLVQ